MTNSYFGALLFIPGVGPIYRRVIPYARKRTHFTSRKEQGEIPVKWSDSRNRQLYLGGEAYGSKLLSFFATLADQEIAKLNNNNNNFLPPKCFYPIYWPLFRK